MECGIEVVGQKHTTAANECVAGQGVRASDWETPFFGIVFDRLDYAASPEKPRVIRNTSGLLSQTMCCLGGYIV